MKSVILISGLFLYSCNLFAQKEANNWVFGYKASVSWAGGSPASQSNSAINQNEGVASISDAQGQLLFYTDGVTIRNGQHQVMANGNGLYGNFSSTQSALIVPKPGSPSIYYVFTTDADGGANGLCYSVVDMAANNGQGAVTTKNVSLYTPTCEKLTATRHANGTDVWVISHRWNSSAFYAYRVSPNGVQGNPVITNIAGVHTVSFGNYHHSYGYMKASPDGRKIAVAVWGRDGWLDVLQFNNLTGMISNPVTDNSFPESGPYGVEFSGDSRYLYASEMNYLDSSKVYQYDLAAGSGPAVIASRKIISTGGTYDNCGMQLGADGRIYIAAFPKPYLNTINLPNASGALCHYQSRSVPLTGGTYSQLGLPNFITSYFKEDRVLQVSVLADTVGCNSPCSGYAGVNVLTGVPPYQYSWQPINYNTQFAANLCVGNYTVTVTDAIGHTVAAVVPVKQAVSSSISISSDRKSICSNDTALLCAGTGFDFYRWNTGETTPCISSGKPGNYQVTATDRFGCAAVSDPLNLQAVTPPVISISVNGNKIYTQMPSNITWYLNGKIISGEYEKEILANSPGYYWVEVRDTNGCVATSAQVYFTSSKDLEADMHVNVYPNPSQSNSCSVIVPSKLIGAALKVQDNQGRLIHSRIINEEHSNLQLDVSSGVYFINIYSQEGEINRRWVRF